MDDKKMCVEKEKKEDLDKMTYDADLMTKNPVIVQGFFIYDKLIKTII